MPRPLFTPGKDPVPIVQEVGWAPGPDWTGAENLAPTGIQSLTVQPVASHYTQYATRPTKILIFLPGFEPQTVEPVAWSLYRLHYCDPTTV